MARDVKDAEVQERLAEVRDMAESLTEEVRLLASSVHPRVLDDLGLVAAVRKLARDTTRATSVDVRVMAPESLELPRPIASVLYRVAQEAVRNAASHAAPRQIRIGVQRGDETVAIDGSSELHVTVWPVSGWPNPSSGIADASVVCPM